MPNKERPAGSSAANLMNLTNQLSFVIFHTSSFGSPKKAGSQLWEEKFEDEAACTGREEHVQGAYGYQVHRVFNDEQVLPPKYEPLRDEISAHDNDLGAKVNNNEEGVVEKLRWLLPRTVAHLSVRALAEEGGTQARQGRDPGEDLCRSVRHSRRLHRVDRTRHPLTLRFGKGA